MDKQEAHSYEQQTNVKLFELPPKGFDPLLCTHEERSKHGFPPLPKDPHLLGMYTKTWNRIKGRYHYVHPKLHVSAKGNDGPRMPPNTGISSTSLNWSGNVVYAPSGQSFQWVEAEWNVPSVGAITTDGTTYFCDSWVGIDGDHTSRDVVQAGVRGSVSANAFSSDPQYWFFYQWSPGAKVKVSVPSVTSGDIVKVLVCVGQPGSTTGTIFFYNITTGQSTSVSISAPSSATLAGNCAEWIVESPTLSAGLADYGTVLFTGCGAGLINGTSTIQPGSNFVNMVDSTGKIVSAAGAFGQDVVACLFQ